MPKIKLPALSSRAKLVALLGVALAVAVLPPLEQIRVSSLLSLGNVGAYSILAVGIVMIYRASKVLNLAHGAMVMFPPYVVKIMIGGASSGARVLAALTVGATAGPLTASLLMKVAPRKVRVPAGTIVAALVTVGLVAAAKAGLPTVAAVAVGIISGASLGYLVERVFVRSLRAQGPTAQTVGTVAALGLIVAVGAKVFGTGGENSVKLFPEKFIEVAGGSIKFGEIMLFFIALAITGGLIMLFQKTDLGLVMRGTAENRRAAALMGVDPDRITALTWIMGGSLAGISGIMLASVTNLHPYVLSLQALGAFVAALLGGMASLPGAVAGAVIVGLTQAIFPNLGFFENIQGVEQLFLALVAVGAMVTRGQRIVGGDVRSESIAAAGARTAKRGLGGLATTKRPLAILGVGLFILFPFVAEFSLVANANRAAAYTMIAVSLVILIGWVGQISLGHAALVGIGAYSTGWIAQGLGIPFPLSLPLGATAAAAIAALLGIVAVRVRGLFLAVATLIFTWMSSEFLFRQDWFIKHFRIDNVSIGREGSFPFFDFSQARTLYFAAWATVALALLAAANLRDSKTGRAFFAVQGSEMAAASLGIDVTRYKLLAFSISGFLAGAAGSLIMSDSRVVGPDDFAFNRSLLFVAIAVVGGLRSLGGSVGAGLIFGLIDVLFLKVDFLQGYLEVFSAGLLAIVLLAYPGGVAALGSQIAHTIGRITPLIRFLTRIDRGIDTFLLDLTWAKQRAIELIRARLEAPALDMVVAFDGPAAPAALPAHAPNVPTPAAPSSSPSGPIVLAPNREDRPIIVRSQNVTVRFGGLTAVNDVSMQVREGEIVGLIGPNGAGKTVSFNSIAGIVVPTEGSIYLGERDVTNSPVHLRARLGIARTFQVLQLFPALTIFENLLVGTHLQNDTDVIAHLTASPRAVAAEAAARQRVKDVVDLLGLDAVVDAYPGDLPFGTLRMVEVARALVTDLKFVMLDEAFSGLDDKETDALVEALMKVRARLGVTLLLIEHDVKLIMSVCDYVYCLDRGTLIAEGVPAEVQRNAAVIAAYLGKAPEEALVEETV